MSKIEVVQINKNIPIPNTYTRYPFSQLEIGDSFTVGIAKKSSVAARVSRLNKQGSRQYLVRKIDENNLGVWRVEDKKEEK